MIIIHSVSKLQEILAAHSADLSVGFVPTMGALHQGHIALVKRSVAENHITVVSIFVNPTQFNNPTDLEKYPRSTEADCALLESVQCDIAFIPSVKEIYPTPDTRVFDFGSLEKVMEGSYRPGHFNGVAQVVSRLFEIVKPTNAYFGQKDFQQLAIIKFMVEKMKLPINIVSCPIVRQENGLALSSRNSRLDPIQIKNAVKISETLHKCYTFVPEKTVKEVIDFATDTLNAIPEMRVEYVEIADGKTLQHLTSWDQSSYIVICVAVYVGEVRLIDNIIVKE